MAQDKAQIIRHATGEAFLARCEPWLLLKEAENNLVLGLAKQVSLYLSAQGAPYLATVEMDGVVVGCAFRTPPWKLILTEMPLDVIPVLVRDLAHQFDWLPAVLAPVAVARAFGEHWAAVRGCIAQDGMQQRLYKLERVVAPERAADGRMRFATKRDLPLIHEWIQAFAAEAVPDRIDVRSIGTERVARRELVLWVDGERRSMAGFSGRSPNGVRVGYVYTPKQWRGRGYASTCVAALSQRALDEGARQCFLYTDLSNTTSNGIYARIGYEPVMDALDVVFEHAQ